MATVWHQYGISMASPCQVLAKYLSTACHLRIDGMWSKMPAKVCKSPAYFYGLSAQLKAFIDRCHNPIRDTFHIRKAALLLVGAASLPELFDSILTQYQLCLNFFHIEDAGHVLVRGAKEKGSLRGSKAMEEAEALGRAIAQ